MLPTPNNTTRNTRTATISIMDKRKDEESSNALKSSDEKTTTSDETLKFGDSSQSGSFSDSSMSQVMELSVIIDDKCACGSSSDEHLHKEHEVQQQNSPGEMKRTNSATALLKKLRFKYTSQISKNPNVSLETYIKELKDSTEKFVKKLASNKDLTQEQRRSAVAQFGRNLEACVTQSSHPALKEKHSFELFNLKDDILSYLYQKLYTSFFETEECINEDEELSQRIDQLSWITPQHLDIDVKDCNNALWDAAKAELLMVNSFITPKQKLVCILNCCKIILYQLSESGSIGSADDFLPHLIYVVLKTNLPKLASTIKMISWFTETDQTIGETFCFFTHLASAVSFITVLDASYLNIDPVDYNRFMGIVEMPSPTSIRDKKYASKALKILGVDPSKRKIMNKFGIDEETASIALSSSLSSVREIPNFQDLTIEDEQESKKRTRTLNWEELTARFPFVTCSANDIQPHHIPELLAGYKEMAMMIASQQTVTQPSG